MKYIFPATCPYCKEKSKWLLSEDEIGQKFVDCEYCGETYVISTKLIPETTCVYSLIEQK
jgi:Zn ribbon nucleic-acid-binding protein